MKVFPFERSGDLMTVVVPPEQLRQPRSSSPDRERAQEPDAFFLSETTRRSASLTASAEPK
jgi:hypothetical protein